MTAPLFRELAEVMAKETECYRRLSALAGEQRDILVSSKIEALPDNVRSGEKQVFQLGPLAGRRNELLAEIGKTLGVKKMDLAQAIQAAPGEVSEVFRESALLLAKTARELEALNQGNDKLLRNALSYVNFTLKAVRTAGRPSAARAGAEKPQTQAAPAFVNRTV
ncbi:MAG TPA: flagellar protein FlgN [bacterium]|nr:flagellar protein FlgN [bacterium]